MNSDSWCSPVQIAGPVYQFFGGPVGCDPCSNESSIIIADVAYTRGGLHKSWVPKPKNPTGYENPPYSRTRIWTDKALVEMEAGLDELVRLVMVATSTEWWEKSVRAPRNPRLLFTKRLPFIGTDRNGDPSKDSARFDTVLMYYGRRWRQFDRHFAHVARWTRWGR